MDFNSREIGLDVLIKLPFHLLSFQKASQETKNTYKEILEILIVLVG
jgi:hypothetical protein